MIGIAGRDIIGEGEGELKDEMDLLSAAAWIEVGDVVDGGAFG